MGEGSV